MSRIRKTPEKVVPSLLARLGKAKEYAHQVVSHHGDDTRTLDSKFDCIENTLQDMEKYLLQIKNWEMTVVEQLGVLDQALDDEIFSFEYPSLETRVGNKLNLIEADVGKLKSLISMVEYPTSVGPSASENQPLNDYDDEGQSVAADHAGQDNVLMSKAMPFLSECFHCLESSQLKKCLVMLSVFPENKAIKKKPLIYWWIGEGLVTESRINVTAEEVGEQIFQELLNNNIIKPMSTRNSFTVYPWIRRELIKLAKKNRLLDFSKEETPLNAYGRAFLRRPQARRPQAMDIDGDNEKKDGDNEEKDVVAIYNMNEQYVGSSPDWLSKPRKLKVLQMGRWHHPDTHHIEAEDYEKLFECLGSQKHLQYLSLRGVSRIETLPRSIRKLTGLLILDLKACHNLNKLPEEVAELRSLTHLDVSECYLLDSMPKGLERLYDLQVLKGFVVSNYCKINDLSGLSRLRKLSIRVGSLGKDQLQSLGAGFKALHILTVLWSKASPDGVTMASLPETLIKLDLRSVPFDVVPQWMQLNKLPNLEKLYIKGGKLNSLNNHDQNVNVKFIRLNYLKNLKINQEALVALFPNYRYLQRTNCHEQYPNLVLPIDG